MPVHLKMKVFWKESTAGWLSTCTAINQGQHLLPRAPSARQRCQCSLGSSGFCCLCNWWLEQPGLQSWTPAWVGSSSSGSLDSVSEISGMTAQGVITALGTASLATRSELSREWGKEAELSTRQIPHGTISGQFCLQLRALPEPNRFLGDGDGIPFLPAELASDGSDFSCQ